MHPSLGGFVPVRGSRLGLRAVVAITLLTAMLLAIPSVAFASPLGSGGWYWPVGTENFQGWDGWWVYRSGNHSWHMAQDMPASVGHAVYAVGDGVILESKADAGYGGVLVVLHRTLEGAEFKAVYGHIVRRKLGVGDRVVAGQVIGTVNRCGHVHFGIHPGREYPSDRNPYRGHTYVKSKTYGWTDPVKFLRANPRTMAYKAPSVPRVTVVTSTVTPTYLGVAKNCVYYSIPASDGATVSYHRPLAGGEPSELPSDTSPPSLDATRFAAASVAASSFAVVDRLPRLAVKYSSRAPGWRKPITVTGTLTNRSGKEFRGARVVLQRSDDGTSWAAVASATTGPHGKYWLQYTPDRRCSLRVRFTPAATYVRTTTTSANVAPRPGLGVPRAPKTVQAGRGFEIEGRLRSRHTAGSHSVTLEFQRLRSGRWVALFTRRTTNRDEDSATRYERALSLARGSWRVRAKMPADSRHAAATTRWARIGVK